MPPSYGGETMAHRRKALIGGGFLGIRPIPRTPGHDSRPDVN